ncbi:4-hydroxy-3-methylbut-2-en-1-yl diphosphate [Cyclospora cayetanensis]|uniref:4-hydroxy-3-methylbut-2-en-1-yl diphosphate n=1 Tax=Cyclospora cayetanensis TaxID=88456 RepID=A0A1D3CSN1_9EIME|nr:4-hydroxy-3-methylbut-2-en-1-yl diphosphate [Cyclospora cayetanensis]
MARGHKSLLYAAPWLLVRLVCVYYELPADSFNLNSHSPFSGRGSHRGASERLPVLHETNYPSPRVAAPPARTEASISPFLGHQAVRARQLAEIPRVDCVPETHHQAGVTTASTGEAVRSETPESRTAATTPPGNSKSASSSEGALGGGRYCCSVIVRCAAAGADLVRLTVQGPKEAEASRAIVAKLRERSRWHSREACTTEGRQRGFAIVLDFSELTTARGCGIPLVADIHFQPRVASLCADIFEKIRVNPGNFADGRKVWEDESAPSLPERLPAESATSGQVQEGEIASLTPETVGSILGPWGNPDGLFDLLPAGERAAFSEGHRRIEEAFLPLVQKCLLQKRALRIGTNHGSLSARILRHFGDTPMGMVLSAIEFADICVRSGFYNFAFSLKSSNPVTMQHAYRLMAFLMSARGALFPLHLGVTEAGEGEDGRIKSAAGIGALLQDGIGDTIRASLTEPPWAELPVCRFLRRMQEHKLQLSKTQSRLQPSSAARVAIPPFEETFRDFAAVSPRGRIRLGRQKAVAATTAPATGTQSQKEQTILHRDGTAVVAIDPQELLNPTSLYSALGLGVVGGRPFRTPLSADAVYLRSLFFPTRAAPDEHQQQSQQGKKKKAQLPSEEKPDSRSLQAARQTLHQLQEAGLTVWADSREIQQVQMTREQLLQHLLQHQASASQQQQLLQQLEEASLYTPGLVAVQRLQDAAAISSFLAMQYLKDTLGVALVADGTETAEEFKAVVSRPNLVCVLVRPADRIGVGVAASRRVSELLRGVARQQPAGGPDSLEESIPILQWVEAPPPVLLSGTAEPQQEEQQTAGNKPANTVSNSQKMTMFAAWEVGSIFLDRLADGLLIDAKHVLSTPQQRQLAFDLLQGCRMRSTKTEFISCPSCGRTLFDIQLSSSELTLLRSSAWVWASMTGVCGWAGRETIRGKVSADIRRRTGHLPGVKIAVMGCIVNGIGEMGDADFGYVGGAPGLVDLYVGKRLVRRGVKSADACDALVEIIKEEGRWKEPEEGEAAP